MIKNDYKTSLLVAEQLPEFIRDNLDYQTFVSFLEAYYQWLETAQSSNSAVTIASTSGEGVTYASKNLLDYTDVDTSLDGFVSYFMADFLPYIPEDALTDKRKLLKIARELYRNKGTEKSYQFLFKALYGKEATIFETSDVILRASDGKWIVTKSVKVNSFDPNWLLINNLRIVGETTKSIATVDYASATGTKTEIFISNIQRLFHSGEIVRVVDNNNLDVYFYDGQVYIQNGQEIPPGATTLFAKIVGVISSIKINPNYRGLYYNTGDPVIVTNGLSPDVTNPIGATATIGTVTTGGILSVVLTDPSNGYRVYPNSSITFTGGGGSGAAAHINLIDETKLANLTMISANSLGIVANTVMGSTSNPVNYTNFSKPANTNSKLSDALTFVTLQVGPIGSVLLDSPGLGYTGAPAISASASYLTDISLPTDIGALGILQPIKINNGGIGYSNANTVLIIGGTGHGAYANVTVNTAGSIISARYVYEANNTIHSYPLGGLAYTTDLIPSVSIQNDPGLGANLSIPGIMGIGASISPTTDKTGSITTINILNPGEDYISAPNVSLKVADVAVYNIDTVHLPEKGDIFYQGASYNTATYSVTLDSITKLTTAFPIDPLQDVYQLRTYDYTGTYNNGAPLKYDRKVSNVTTTYTVYPTNYYLDSNNNPTSIKRYGDGNAKATASFLDGLIVGQGKWLNVDGQLSSLGLVLESKDYNNYTYVLSVEKALATYKDIALNLLHASGTRMIGRNLLKSANGFTITTEDVLQKGYHMGTAFGPSTYATIDSQGGEISTNIIHFHNMIGSNIADKIFVNDYIEYTATNNVKVYSEVTNVDYTNNQITIQDNVFVLFANVATGYANASSNVINISTVTGQYDGNFSNPTPANNIIFVGDTVSLNGGPFYTVQQVFSNGNIRVANNSFGPINNAYITVNKSANTQDVIIYGVIGEYTFPQLLTENGYILNSESGNILLAG
jgi:hypothetical protein